MKKPPSNARRFVNAAWSLLTFQLIASAGAVGVTGWAAFHVADLAQQVREQPAAPERAEAQPAEEFPSGPGPDEKAPEEIAPPPNQIIPVEPNLATRPSPCLHSENLIRVPAEMEWCDTGIVLRQGQSVSVRAQGRWSNAGEPRFGPAGFPRVQIENLILPDAPLASLIGRIGDSVFPIGEGNVITSPAEGPLYLSINDVPGTFQDNQGWMDVYIGVAVVQ